MSPRAMNPLLQGFKGGTSTHNFPRAEKEKDSLLLVTICWGILRVSLPSFHAEGGKARGEEIAMGEKKLE